MTETTTEVLEQPVAEAANQSTNNRKSALEMVLEIIHMVPSPCESIRLDVVGHPEVFHVRKGLSYSENLRFATYAGFNSEGKLHYSPGVDVTERVVAAALFIGLSKSATPQLVEVEVKAPEKKKLPPPKNMSDVYLHAYAMKNPPQEPEHEKPVTRWATYFNSYEDTLEFVRSPLVGDVVSVLFERVLANNPKLIVLNDKPAQDEAKPQAGDNSNGS